MRTLAQTMGMFFHSAEAAPERPADPVQRRANLRRIAGLFAPYRLRLSGVLLLIVVTAALGVIPAFLLKRALEAIAENDVRALSFSAGVNNVFDRDPPQCFTCDSANFDPTTYDLPGQFGYVRLSYGF